MPSSRPNTIPTVINLLRQLKPQSILDVGVGFGKWGHLFREYTDILEAEHEPARYCIRCMPIAWSCWSIFSKSGRKSKFEPPTFHLKLNVARSTY